MKRRFSLLLACAMAASFLPVPAAANPIIVNVDNLGRAQTDMEFDGIVKLAGGVNTLQVTARRRRTGLSHTTGSGACDQDETAGRADPSGVTGTDESRWGFPLRSARASLAHAQGHIHHPRRHGPAAA